VALREEGGREGERGEGGKAVGLMVNVSTQEGVPEQVDQVEVGVAL
jgi:hypothetical protein